MRAWCLFGAALLSVVLSSCQIHEASAASSEGVTFFHPDPRNIANRLYAQLHVRKADGKQYGADFIDPLLWEETNYLLAGASHRQAMALLNEFLRTHGEQQITDPLKRAILQRDLWAVFDWADAPDGPHAAERGQLFSELGSAVGRLALTDEEIAALPDTFALAIQKREFPAEYDSANPNQAFLPLNLFDPRGPWVCVGAPGEGLAAPLHDLSFTARSAFLVFARLPGGREATIAYFKQLAEMKTPLYVKMQLSGFQQPMDVFNSEVPQFPVGTEFALLRRMLLPDRDAHLRVTPMTESVQIRHYTDVPNVDPDRYRDVSLAAQFQSASEIQLSRASLFSGHSGLRGVTVSDLPFLVFPAMTHGFDQFEDSRMRTVHSISPLASCTGCHLGPGIQSVMSFSFRANPSQGAVFSPRLGETTPGAEWERVIAWAQKQDKWKDLLRLWSPASTN